MSENIGIYPEELDTTKGGEWVENEEGVLEFIKEETFFDPYFLQEQIRLPEDQWDENFRRLVDKKREENQKENKEIKERTSKGLKKEQSKESEDLRRKVFERYKRDLNIKEDNLKNKTVLDLGCGERGLFVKHLLYSKITDKAYGIDIDIDEKGLKKTEKTHLLRGDFEEKLPIDGADYIFQFGAVVTGGLSEEGLLYTLKNWLHSLKEGGEIKIYPAQEPSKANPFKQSEQGLSKDEKEMEVFMDQAIEQDLPKYKKALEAIAKEEEIEYSFEPKEIKVLGKSNRLSLFYLLTIRKLSTPIAEEDN